MLLADPSAAAARELLAGICAAVDGGGTDPGFGASIALAFDALVDPGEPPPPWHAQPVADPVAAARDARRQVAGLLEQRRPAAELAALGESARHLEDGLYRAEGGPVTR